MDEIGVKRLKNDLSEVLRRVAAGEHVRVTVRGRVVAELVPVAEKGTSALDRAVAAGRVTPARVSVREAPPLIEAPSASTEILAEREEDR